MYTCEIMIVSTVHFVVVVVVGREFPTAEIIDSALMKSRQKERQGREAEYIVSARGRATGYIYLYIDEVFLAWLFRFYSPLSPRRIK